MDYNVVSAIQECVGTILTFPKSGRPSPHDGVREAIERQYGFVIPYILKSEAIFVLRVYRSRRKPLDYSTMDLP